jgi:ribosomal protein S6--L-glutamate ligase
MARRCCPRVFPDYTARFGYPGKIGQIHLFRSMGVRHPVSEAFYHTDQFANRYRSLPEDLPYPFPFVVKFDWGGEGQTVSIVESTEQLEAVVERALDFERTGLSGFILQEFIPCSSRVLRVAVIGSEAVSYWRVGADASPSCISAAAGAQIDVDSDPELQRRAVDAVTRFARKARIDLAGFDLLYADDEKEPEPYFLEINYFFGRRGLGGSERFYELLNKEIHHWLSGHGLSLRSGESRM